MLYEQWMKCMEEKEFGKMWTFCRRCPGENTVAVEKGATRWARLTEIGGLLQKAGSVKENSNCCAVLFHQGSKLFRNFLPVPWSACFQVLLVKEGERGKKLMRMKWVSLLKKLLLGGNKASILKELRTGWEWGGVWGEGGESRNEEVRATVSWPHWELEDENQEKQKLL